MNTFKTKINNYLSKNSIFIFAIITLLIMLNRIPFWDETHAFSISRLCLNEIFYITRIEGHPFLWYLVLKPFNSLNFYPWSMWLINWFFCLGALFVLWKKAPFSPITKALITFSTPFVYYFGPVARCYSIGIFFLFLICAFYKKRFKRPFLYSSLIAICANTSLMTMIGVFYLGLLFLYDLVLKLKHKTFSIKKFYGVISIFLFCTILILLQFVGVRKMGHELIADVWDNFSRFVLFPRAISFMPFLMHIVASVSFYYFGYLTYKKSKRGFFFVSLTYLTLTLIFLLVYTGSHWNYYFYFIYFVVLLWIFGRKILVSKFSKIIFMCLLILFLFPKAVLETGKMDLIYASRSKLIANHIVNNETLKSAKLYTLEWWSDLAPGALMYLEREDIYIYDLHNRKRTSFDSIKNIFYMEYELIDFDKFYKSMDKNSYLLSMDSLFKQNFINLIVMEQENGDYIFKTENKTYYLKIVFKPKDTNLTVYKISEM